MEAKEVVVADPEILWVGVPEVGLVKEAVDTVDEVTTMPDDVSEADGEPDDVGVAVELVALQMDVELVMRGMISVGKVVTAEEEAENDDVALVI